MSSIKKRCVNKVKINCERKKNRILLVFLQNVPQVDEEGFCIRPEVNENDILFCLSQRQSFSLVQSSLLDTLEFFCFFETGLNETQIYARVSDLRLLPLSSLTSLCSHAKENSFYSSSDSEDEDEPRKFHVQIKPVQPNNGVHRNQANIDELKASIGNIILSPSTSVRLVTL